MMSHRQHEQLERNMIRRVGTVVGALAIAGMVLACNRSDPTAPTDSTITVSANPQTVVLDPTDPNHEGTTTITATVRSKNGTRLPDQEVTFSTTNGSLAPPAETPIITNTDGQASCELSTPTSATVTARSGSITGSTQVTTVTGNIGSFNLSVIPQSIGTCNDVLDLEVTVLDTNGDPLENVSVEFKLQGGSKLTGTFRPPSGVTNPSGILSATWTPDSTVCSSSCTDVGDPNGPGICSDLFFVACTSSCSIQSNTVRVTEDVP